MALAGWLIHRALRDLSFDEVQRALTELALGHVLLAIGLAVASFVTLTGSETLGVRSTGQRLPYPRIALTSFLALSIGHTLGLAALSSGAIRLRLYTTFGLSPAAVVQVIVMCAVTVLLGLATLAGISSVSNPPLSARVLHLTPSTTAILGWALLSFGAIYLLLVAVAPRVVHIRRHVLRLPSPRVALGQLVVGTLDCLLVAGVLHQMLSAAGAQITYLTVMIVYALATAAAIILHVPGGLGVIEAAVISVVPSAAVAGALVGFRLVYYLAPFVAGCAVFAAFEWLHLVKVGPRRHMPDVV